MATALNKNTFYNFVDYTFERWLSRVFISTLSLYSKYNEVWVHKQIHSHIHAEGACVCEVNVKSLCEEKNIETIIKLDSKLLFLYVQMLVHWKLLMEKIKLILKFYFIYV